MSSNHGGTSHSLVLPITDEMATYINRSYAFMLILRSILRSSFVRMRRNLRSDLRDTTVSRSLVRSPSCCSTDHGGITSNSPPPGWFDSASNLDLSDSVDHGGMTSSVDAIHSDLVPADASNAAESDVANSLGDPIVSRVDMLIDTLRPMIEHRAATMIVL